jgi:hypothetical protein
MDALGTHAGYAVMIGRGDCNTTDCQHRLVAELAVRPLHHGHSRPTVGACMSIIGFRPVWGLCGAKFLSDSAWYC